MRACLPLFAILMAAFCGNHLHAFQPVQSISGELDPGPEKLDGITIVTWTKEGPPADTGNIHGRASVDKQGKFAMNGSAAGTYRVCVHAINQEFIDPCEWGEPLRVDFGKGAGAKAMKVALKRGVRLQIRVSDPKGLLKSPQNPEAEGYVMAHLWQHTGRGVPMRAKFQTRTELLLEAVVPEDTLMRVQLRSRHARLVQDETAGSRDRLLFPESEPGSVIRSGKVGRPQVFSFTVQGE